MPVATFFREHREHGERRERREQREYPPGAAVILPVYSTAITWNPRAPAAPGSRSILRKQVLFSIFTENGETRPEWFTQGARGGAARLGWSRARLAASPAHSSCRGPLFLILVFPHICRRTAEFPSLTPIFVHSSHCSPLFHPRREFPPWNARCNRRAE